MDYIGSHPLQELKECNFTSNLSPDKSLYLFSFSVTFLFLPFPPPLTAFSSFLSSFPPSLHPSFFPFFLLSFLKYVSVL